MIQVRDLTFTYPTGTTVFQEFSWQAADGEPWAIIGPSGCGKSTLLYLLAGLRTPTVGQVIINGQAISRPRPETGLVLQDYGLMPWATLRQNVALGLRIRRFYGPDGRHAPKSFRPEDTAETVSHWLDRLNINEQADKYPSQVSGGQRQRAAIARTLVLAPDLLLMDEPFSSLDAFTREDLQNVVLDLHRETGISFVIVTHNIEEAVFMGHKLLVLGEPPNTAPVIVDNPAAAAPGYRNSLDYLDQCNHVRQMMGLGV